MKRGAKSEATKAAAPIDLLAAALAKKFKGDVLPAGDHALRGILTLRVDCHVAKAPSYLSKPAVKIDWPRLAACLLAQIADLEDGRFRLDDVGHLLEESAEQVEEGLVNELFLDAVTAAVERITARAREELEPEDREGATKVVGDVEVLDWDTSLPADKIERRKTP
jgi:hypothetical protein